MTTDALFWSLKQRIGRPAENLTLIHLADRADNDDESFPSIMYIEKRTGMNRKTIINALDNLESKGYIKDTGRRKGSTCKVKVYRLNLASGIVPEKELLNEIVPETDGNSTVFSCNSTVLGTQILLDTTIDTKNLNPISLTPHFDEFWKIYPNAVAKKKSLEIWKKKKLDSIAETILDDVRRKSKDEAWTKENGRFVPLSTTYLTQERWTDKPKQEAQKRERAFVV